MQMADQNPIQNDQTNGATPVTQTPDLLGDISLNIPEAPTQETGENVSDLGNILVEQSMENAQEKAESSIPEAPIASVSAESVPVENTDPTAIDLGDISIPASDDPIAGPQPEANPAADSQPSGGMFHAPEEMQNDATSSSGSSTPEAVESSAATASEADALTALEIPAAPEPVSESEPESAATTEETAVDAPVMEEITPTPATDLINETESTVAEESTQTEDMSDIAPDGPAEEISEMPAAPEPMPEEINELPVMTATEELPTNPIQAEPLTDLPLPEEKSDDSIDMLMSNEQEQVTAPEEPVVETPTDTPATTSNDEGFDLDSLTSDLIPKGNETPAAQDNNAVSTDIVTAAEPQPAPIASVTLPDATLVQTNVHKSTKKKAFAMVAAFLMLLVAGGFVFDTMMPEESDKLMASILGWTSQPETETSMSPEVPTEQSPEWDDVTNLITDASENVDDTSMLTEDDTAIETPTDPGNTPANNIIDSEESSNTEAATEIPTSTPAMTMEEARTKLNLLVQDSKKLLATALKAGERQASTMLRITRKDSEALLDALANTSDISTIANIETQIDNLQKNLNQATIILNVASNNAQSQ